MSEYGLLGPVIAQLEAWSVQDAIEAEREHRAAGGEIASRTGPLYQWQAWCETLPILRERYETGDSKALLRALDVCAYAGLPMPAWCRHAYQDSFRKLVRYDCRSLDEAFGYDLKGVNLVRAQERFRKSYVVALGVRLRVLDGETVEDALRAVADEFSVSFSRAREWYYSHPIPELPVKSENPRKD